MQTETNPQSINPTALRQQVQLLAAALVHMQRQYTTLRALIDRFPDGILVLDATDSVLAISAPLAQFLGTTPEAVCGRRWHDLAVARQLPYLHTLVAQARQDSTDTDAHTQYEQLIPADGQAPMLQVQHWCLPSPSGGAAPVALHFTALPQPTAEVHTPPQEQHAAIKHLSGVLAHEINTPLQTIETALYLAQHSTEPQRTHMMTLAQDQVPRINIILHRLLDLPRIPVYPDALATNQSSSASVSSSPESASQADGSGSTNL